MKKRLALVALILASGAAAATACSFDDENPALPGQGGKPDGSVGSSSGSTSSGGSSGQSGALCAKVGGYDTGVADITSAVINQLANDCRVAAHFAVLNAGQQQHLSECLQIQLGEFLGCPNVKYAGAKDSKGQACRDMGQAHQNMQLRGDDFKVFLNATVAVAKSKGLTDDDLQSVIGSVNGTYTAVVRNGGTGQAKCTCAQPSTLCTPPVIDAGNDTGTTEAGTDAGVSDAADGGG
jgi:hypothetical protein